MIDFPTSLDSFKASLKKFVKESDIQIGILFKKGSASKDSLLKSYKLDNLAVKLKSERRDLKKGLTSTSSIAHTTDIENMIGCEGSGLDFENGVNIPAIIGRVELYVDESKWKDADKNTKSLLYAFICRIEDNM